MDRKINIVKLFYTFDIETAGGGLSLYATDLGAILDHNHFDVRLCSLGYYDSPQARERMVMLNNKGCRTMIATQWDGSHSYKSLLRAFFSLYHTLSKEHADIVHSHSEYTDLVALLLKLSGRASCIIRTIHTGHQHEWVIKPVMRALFPNFLYPIFFNLEVGINQEKVSLLDQRLVARLLGKTAEKIHNALSIERINQIQQQATSTKNQENLITLKNALGIPIDAPVIGSVGRLAKQKGYCYLIDAASILLKHIPSACFLIIGEGELHSLLARQAQELGIQEHIFFTGARNDVDCLLQCMDIFVSSSLWEGLPSVIMEAMAGRIPVIATDISGTRELIQHNINGILVPPADAEQMALVTLDLLNSPDKMQHLVQGGLATLPSYSLEQAARDYESLYTRLVMR